jgi:hypothetical protein
MKALKTQRCKRNCEKSPVNIIDRSVATLAYGLFEQPLANLYNRISSAGKNFQSHPTIEYGIE